MYIVIVMKDHLSWKTTKFGGRFVQTSLQYQTTTKHKNVKDHRTISQIPQCTSSIPHSAPFKTKMCTILFWMVHCEVWDMFIVGLFNLVYHQIEAKTKRWTRLILGTGSANEKRRYYIKLSLIGWAHTQNEHHRCEPCMYISWDVPSSL